MLSSESFLQSLFNSILYMIFLVIFQVGGAISISLLVSQLNKKWKNLSRILFYLPVLSAGIFIAQIWKWVFHQRGLFNWILELINLEPVSWFASTETGIPSISLIVSFSGLGSGIIILLSAIDSISKDLIEAAQLDGASKGIINRKIILPLISNTISMLVLLAIISAPLIWETIYALAPLPYTSTMAWFIYQEAFVFGNYGGASAAALLLMVFMCLLTAIKNRIKNA
jgi:ABC-type sugar transport system permease subunit